MELLNKDNIWVGVEELKQDPSFLQSLDQEFNGQSITETLANENVSSTTTSSRRDFLKYLGFGLGAATIAASCEIPVKKALPYVTKPDTIVPGVATYYASSFVNGGDYASILVKTREGRPIKIEGNPMSKVSKGVTGARAQAMVLSLYDNNRLQYPGKVNNGNVDKLTWEELDKEVKSKLNGNIRLVSNTILSNTYKKVISEFIAKYPSAKHITYDSVSYSGLLDANAQNFGKRVLPTYKFDQALTIVAFNADFLGTWISPEEFAKGYAQNRRIDDVKNAKMSRHYHVESGMSLTGSNADHRILVKPSEQGAAIANLYNEVALLTGGTNISAPKVNDAALSMLKKAAKDLVANKGKSLVVSGSNNTNEQILVNAINALLGNIGTTIDFNEHSNRRQGSDTDYQNLIKEMASGSVNTIIFLDSNPVFDGANNEQFKSALSKVGTKVAISSSMNETVNLCNFVANAHHNLESWGDANPVAGHYSFVQPTIAPLFDSRQAESTLLAWTDNSMNYHDYLMENWKSMQSGSGFASFQAFWDNCLHDGVISNDLSNSSYNFSGDVIAALNGISKPSNAPLEVSIYESVNIGAGQYANNPWLMEMPDPVLRTVWGNYLSVPMNWDGVNNYTSFENLEDGDLVDVEINGKKFTCIAMRQFGQMPGTVSIALGYGRETVGLTGKNVGTNINSILVADDKGNTQYYSTQVSVKKNGKKDKNFACVQYHHTMGVTDKGKEENAVINADEKILGYKGFQGSLTKRTVIKRTNLNELPKAVEELQEQRAEFKKLNDRTLYPGHQYKYTSGHHWNLFVDLNSCTGCGACTVACMAENNVPVVGKFEVHRHHEMTWLRIDRYYYGDINNPNVVYQPLMCHHCDNAPCENVCPVNATNHSSDGLNQMTYNRCIGTRYCANNCPYKVRRFNWLDYTTADLFSINENRINGEELPFYADNLTRMVLNPDVTVRSRGVIEKCSFCVQRIQEGKLIAKREERQLHENDVKTACQTACPTGAITFGDRNNKETKISKLIHSPMAYRVIEEVNIDPNVVYSMKVTNRSEESIG